jgi:hypothetical protein
LKEEKKIYSVFTCCFGFAFSFFAAFFSVLCQWLMNSYEKQEFVFFLGKEKNKSFLFSCHENRLNDVL